MCAAFQKNQVLLNKLNGICVAHTLLLRGRALLESCDFDAAVATLRESAELWRATLGDGSDHGDFVGTLLSLGIALRRIDFGSDEARKVLTEALDVFQRSNCDSGIDQKLANILHELGSIAMRKDEHELAKDLFLKTYIAMMENGKEGEVLDKKISRVTSGLGLIFGVLERNDVSER